jgi:hypothetical protein
MPRCYRGWGRDSPSVRSELRNADQFRGACRPMSDQGLRPGFAGWRKQPQSGGLADATRPWLQRHLCRFFESTGKPRGRRSRSRSKGAGVEPRHRYISAGRKARVSRDAVWDRDGRFRLWITAQGVLDSVNDSVYECSVGLRNQPLSGLGSEVEGVFGGLPTPPIWREDDPSATERRRPRTYGEW